MEFNTFNHPDYQMKTLIEPSSDLEGMVEAGENSEEGIPMDSFWDYFSLDDIAMAMAAAMGRPLDNFGFGSWLKMTAASLYIPKNNPDLPRGQDAHFIYRAAQTIGVADGVGGCLKRGIDSGVYARQLMVNAVLALLREPDSQVNPKRVLEHAYRYSSAQGSSTACIITFSGDKLRAANVGDSGFVVIRNGAVLYKSPTQQRGFNCPYQLGATKDNPSVAEEIEVTVEAGDVVVAGTDGLLDNMHEEEMVEIVSNHRIKEGSEMIEEACNYLANAALYNSFDKYTESPFSIAARKAGRYRLGGKVDDITVVIARIGY